MAKTWGAAIDREESTVETAAAPFDPFANLSDGAIPVFDALRNRCEAELEKRVEANHPTAENVLKKNPDEAIARAAADERYPTPRFAEPIFIGVGLSDIVAFAEGQYDFAMTALDRRTP